MESIDVNGVKLELDEKGFLMDPALWNDDVAVALAKAEGVDSMSEDQWKAVRYIREHYDKWGFAPMVRKLAKEIGLDMATVNGLFEHGPAMGACKVAGLPKPTGCL